MLKIKIVGYALTVLISAALLCAIEATTGINNLCFHWILLILLNSAGAIATNQIAEAKSRKGGS